MSKYFTYRVGVTKPDEFLVVLRDRRREANGNSKIPMQRCVKLCRCDFYTVRKHLNLYLSSSLTLSIKNIDNINADVLALQLVKQLFSPVAWCTPQISSCYSCTEPLHCWYAPGFAAFLCSLCEPATCWMLQIPTVEMLRELTAANTPAPRFPCPT